MTSATHSSRIADTLRDTASRTTTAQRELALIDAVVKLSQDKPRRVVTDLVMTSANILPVLPDWVAGFSQVLSIETPIGQIPPAQLDAESWFISATPTGEVVVLAAGLAIGASVRVTHTAYHVCDATQDTTAIADAEAIACWAAAILGDQIAASYSDASAPTIAADRVDQSNPAREWAKRAQGWRQRYRELIGVAADRVAPAGVVVNLDLQDSRGYPRQTHWRNR